MAHEKPGFRRQREQPLDRTIELRGVAARKIGARGAVVRHEQRIADEHRIADLVANIGRRMTGRVHHLDGKLTDAERLAIGKQVVEVTAIRAQIFGVEHRAENPLHVLDVLADPDPGTGFGFDIGRAGQVVRMRVGLQRPFDRQPLLSRGGKNGFHRTHVDRSDRDGRNPARDR